MTALTSQQLKEYNDKGYLAPINVLSLEEVNKIKTEIEYIEKKWPLVLIIKITFMQLFDILFKNFKFFFL